jgi:hypothetical protein
LGLFVVVASKISNGKTKKLVYSAANKKFNKLLLIKTVIPANTKMR